MLPSDEKVVLSFREEKELEKFAYILNQFILPSLEQGKEKIDKVYNYFKEDRKDLSIVAATGAIIGAMGYAATEVASKIASSMITPSNNLNLAHPHIHGFVHKIAPIANNISIKIGNPSIHHGAHLANQALSSTVQHGGTAAIGSSHAAGGISATLLPLFTATVISVSVAMICYELYQRNEKYMAKYVESHMSKSPELSAYIDAVGRESGAIDRFKKGEYPRLKDITVMTELTGRYLYGKSVESITILNDQAQNMISSVSKYLNSQQVVR